MIFTYFIYYVCNDSATGELMHGRTTFEMSKEIEGDSDLFAIEEKIKYNSDYKVVNVTISNFQLLKTEK